MYYVDCLESCVWFVIHTDTVGKGSCKRSTRDHLGPFSHVPLDRVKQGVKFNVNAMNLSGLPLGSFEG